MTYVSLYGGIRPIHAGNILTTFYSDEGRVRELIALGNLSRLGKYLRSAKGQRHSFDKPLPDTVLAYARDRGDVRPKTYTFPLQEFFEETNFPYLYLYHWGGWSVKSPGDLPFHKLDQNILDGKKFM